MPVIKKLALMVIMMLVMGGILLILGCGNEGNEEDPERHTLEEETSQAETTKEEPTPEEIKNMKAFSDGDFGYTILYPDHWTYEILGNVVTFKGPEDTNEYHTVVTIEKLLSQAAGGVYKDLESVFESFKLQFEGAGRQIIEKEDMIFEHDDTKYPAIHFLAEYDLEEEPIRQWTAVLYGNDNYFLQFSYTAPVDIYEQFKHFSGDMWLSLELTE